MKAVLWAVVLFICGTVGALAQDLSALARLDAGASAITQSDGGLHLELRIGQPVPWRVRHLDGPPRVVIDTREVDWQGIAGLERPPAVTGLRAGVLRPGWTRLVVELAQPMVATRAGMLTGDGTATIEVTLAPATAEAFAARAAQPDPADWTLPDAAALPAPPARGHGPLTVVLDPGHGGLDPGAERDGLTEADLMLGFARELKEELLRAGGFRVVLTRDDDVFVPLETRISIARAANAHVFLSL
ncbi:MAG TPA: N-acetylmuramoyl-L-alanine amidase, partial [Paracoccaceae bacterium]|nr:N-acetylmuramoyl-L-alanine amidase [Paracoccaceae bacterium]